MNGATDLPVRRSTEQTLAAPATPPGPWSFQTTPRLSSSPSLIAQTGAPSAPGAPPPPPGPTQIAAIVIALGVIGAGLWLLIRARHTPPEGRCDPPLPLVGPVRRASLYALAMCVILGGYHIAAWSVPAWLPLHVPTPRWWMLVLGLTLAIGGTLLAEKLEREPEPPRP